MAFRRRCRDNMLQVDWTGTSEQLWAAAGRPRLMDMSRSPGPAETIVELSQFGSYRPPRAMLAMEFIDGLLAVHQGGSYLALLHPFRFAKIGSPGEDMLLFEREESLAEPSDCRPFAPQKMGDYRHILFSTPTAVYAVNVWSLRDWTFHQQQERFHVLVDVSDGKSPQLACRPLPLDETRIGVLSRGADGRHLWRVLELPRLIGAQPIRDLADGSVPLDVTGAACHVEMVQNNVIVFGTTDGHWAWFRQDALECQGNRLRRTSPSDVSGTLVANLHEERPHEFHALRHYLFHDHPPSGRQPRHFTWYYQRRGHPVQGVECYRVNLQTLDADYPTTLDENLETVPLGAYLEGDSIGAPRRMLFCNSRRLFYDTKAKLRRVEAHGQIEEVKECPGSIFRDPLLMVMGYGRSASLRTLTIRSLHHPNQTQVVTLSPLRADPLIWSQWLFTLESEDDHSLTLQRRDLQP
jgi:hypothetical protein